MSQACSATPRQQPKPAPAHDHGDQQRPLKRHKSGDEESLHVAGGPGEPPKAKGARRPVLSFADELDEEPSPVAFSLAESTMKRFQQERPLTVGPAPAAPQLSHSVFEEYASASQTKALGMLSLAASHARGARPYMEDRHTIIANYMPAGPLDNAVLRTYAAVFDGHNGVESAEHASSRLHQHLAAQKGVGTCRGVAGSAAAEAEAEVMRQALENSFIQTDDEILDRARLEDGRDGACALVVLRIGDCLWTAHAGDSRAILSRGGHALRLTEDHKPGLEREAQRVKAVGARVEFQRCWRVISTARGINTGLAVSRSLGDLDFKEPKMLVERKPDVGIVALTPEDGFVVLASDGLWDVLSDQEAVDVAQEALRKGTPSSGAWQPPGAGDASAKAAATALVAAALKKGSLDNITCVMALMHWGT